MLELFIPGEERYDERKEEFVEMPGVALRLEHSLSSVSKWESKWHKPFLGSSEKTKEEMYDYINCMSLDGEVDETLFKRLDDSLLGRINEYILDKRSATWFPESKNAPNREVVTSELIYYWMVTYSIPFECENWHLNRLLTLIRVCNVKNSPPKKMSKSEIASRNRELNAQRRARLNTKG